MDIPFSLKARMGAAMAYSKGGEFAIGWANGVVRYHRRSADLIDGNPFERGTVKFAASEAAVAYCRGMEP